MANLQYLATVTEEFNGADLAQIIRMATTEATNRVVEVSIFEEAVKQKDKNDKE